MTLFNASGHRWRHADCAVRLDEIVIREIQRDRSFKVFKLLAESVCQASQATAVHPQRVILLFNVRRGDQSHVWRSADCRLFNFHHFRRAIPDGGWRGKITERG